MSMEILLLKRINRGFLPLDLKLSRWPQFENIISVREDSIFADDPQTDNLLVSDFDTELNCKKV